MVEDPSSRRSHHTQPDSAVHFPKRHSQADRPLEAPVSVVIGLLRTPSTGCRDGLGACPQQADNRRRSADADAAGGRRHGAPDREGARSAAGAAPASGLQLRGLRSRESAQGGRARPTRCAPGAASGRPSAAPAGPRRPESIEASRRERLNRLRLPDSPCAGAASPDDPPVAVGAGSHPRATGRRARPRRRIDPPSLACSSPTLSRRRTCLSRRASTHRRAGCSSPPRRSGPAGESRPARSDAFPARVVSWAHPAAAFGTDFDGPRAMGDDPPPPWPNRTPHGRILRVNGDGRPAVP